MTFLDRRKAVLTAKVELCEETGDVEGAFSALIHEGWLIIGYFTLAFAYHLLFFLIIVVVEIVTIANHGWSLSTLLAFAFGMWIGYDIIRCVMALNEFIGLQVTSYRNRRDWRRERA